MSVADANTTAVPPQTQSRADARARPSKSSEAVALIGGMVIVCGIVVNILLVPSGTPIPVLAAVIIIPAIAVALTTRVMILLFTEQNVRVKNLGAKQNVFLWGFAFVFLIADVLVMFTDFFFKH